MCVLSFAGLGIWEGDERRQYNSTGRRFGQHRLAAPAAAPGAARSPRLRHLM